SEFGTLRLAAHVADGRARSADGLDDQIPVVQRFEAERAHRRARRVHDRFERDHLVSDEAGVRSHLADVLLRAHWARGIGAHALAQT
ncbi:hypothetical protein ACSTLK_23735, partial [Vibrio parahaemolyticus]